MMVNINSLIKALDEVNRIRKRVIKPPLIETIKQDPIEKQSGIWLDPRASQEVKKAILEVSPELIERCAFHNDYDACSEWMSVLLGYGFVVDMYKGNGGHYWLSINDALFDPKADKVVGYPSLTSDSYDAEKVIWKGDSYVDNEILNENPY